MSDLRGQALAVLRQVLAQDDPGERAATLERLCGEKASLRREVEALLAADGEDDAGLDMPIGFKDPSPDPREDELVGGPLGPFHILEKVGRGGMGTVYRARRTAADFDQEVAIKVLRRGLDSDDILARFLRERRILASLSHPKLTHLIDGGLTPDGRPWLAMDFVSGVAITQWCDERRLDPRARIALLLEVAEAVQYAHEHLVVHRDLKPGNVLVDEQGRVRLLDFGIAKLIHRDPDADTTVAGQAPLLLTPGYAAPEQLHGAHPITAATDVYALGVMLYELLSGRLPHRFEHGDRHGIRNRQLDTLAPRLSEAIAGADREPPDSQHVQRLRQRAISMPAYRRLVRGDLDRIVSTALAPEPERRYPSVQAFAEDLRRFLNGQPVTVTGDRWRYRLGKFVARNRAGVALAGLSVAFAVAGISGIVWQWREAQHQATVARAEVKRTNAVRDYMTLMVRQASEAGEISAREVLARSAGRIEAEFADDPAARQSVLAAMAELYIHLQDYQGARPLLERFAALEDGSSPLPVRVAALDELAVVELRQGNAQAALTAAESALALLDDSRGTDSERLRSRLLVTRGQTHRALGRHEQAITDLETALRLAQAAEGPDARQTAVVRNSLAVAYMSTGRLVDALREFEATLAAFERLELGESADALNVYNNLGSLKLLRGRIDEAEPLLERAAHLQRSLVGDSAGLAASLLNHGRVLLLRNRIEAARAQMHDAHAMLRQFTSPGSLDLASAELALADAALMAGAGETAGDHADSAHAILQALLPPTHPLIGRVHLARAESLFMRSDTGRAREELARALDVLEAAGDLALPNLSRALCLGAELHLAQDRATRAMGDAERCLALRQEYADPDSWEIALAQALLDVARLRAGDRQAEAGVAAARRRLAAALGADHPVARRLQAVPAVGRP